MASIRSWWQFLGDRRKNLRHAVRQRAFINLEDGAALRSCLILDLSDNGAKLVIVRAGDLPEEFTLFLPRRCRIARRLDEEIGVRFIDRLPGSGNEVKYRTG